MKKRLSRRGFLEGVGACTLGGAALSELLRGRSDAASEGLYRDPGSPQNAAPWHAPAKLTSPNILVIMVDQMRWPQWVSQSQMAILDQQILPNIFGRLRDRSYVFEQYYTASTDCTAARSTLLTGLYTSQTAVYIDSATGLNTPNSAALVPAFPTWGEAIAALNPALFRVPDYSG